MLRTGNSTTSRLGVGLLAVLLLSAPASAADLGDDAIRVLFIGNSYTYFNNLPAMLSTLTGEDPRSLPRQAEVPEVSMAGVVSAENTLGVRVDEADATLIHQVVRSVHVRQQENGGYLSAEPVPAPEEPRVPAGVTPSKDQLTRTWRGSGVLLPETTTEFAVDLSKPGGVWRAVAGLDFDRDVFDQHHECGDVSIDGALVSFSHPFDMSVGDQSGRPLLKYELAYTGDSVTGTVTLVHQSRELGVSSIVLR